MMATSNTYTPPARIWRTLTFADLLDAAGIASISVSVMGAAEWTALATAAGVHPPSPETCTLTVTILRRRENVRCQLQPLVQPARRNSNERSLNRSRGRGQ